MTAHAGAPAPIGASDRPLRRDAERNRQRILAAAAEVLSERGLDATLDEVARTAGVGVGTVYRRFPDKESLIEALFQDRIDAMVSEAEQALTEPDPWRALVAYLDFAVTVMAGNLGLRQLLMFSTYGKERVAYARSRMQPVVTKLVERAHASGDLRPDFAGTDVKMIVFMLSSLAEYASPARPDLWRRYLALLIDGLRPARDTVTELPATPPTSEDIEAAMCTPGQRLGPRRLPEPDAQAFAHSGPTAPSDPSDPALPGQLRARAAARTLARAFSGALIPCMFLVHDRAELTFVASSARAAARPVNARASAMCICSI